MKRALNVAEETVRKLTIWLWWTHEELQRGKWRQCGRKVENSKCKCALARVLCVTPRELLLVNRELIRLAYTFLRGPAMTFRALHGGRWSWNRSSTGNWAGQLSSPNVASEAWGIPQEPHVGG